MMTLEERREILNGIAVQHGGKITPELVVELAKDPNHPLHYEFDWNDASAAYKQRLATARTLIRSVTIEVKTTQAVVVVPNYVRDPSVGHKEQGYISLTVAKKQKEDGHAIIGEYLERIEANVKSGHAIALSLGLETEFLARLQRILTVVMSKPKKSKTTISS